MQKLLLVAKNEYSFNKLKIHFIDSSLSIDGINIEFKTFTFEVADNIDADNLEREINIDLSKYNDISYYFEIED